MGGSLALAARKAAWAERIVAIDRKLPAGRTSQSYAQFRNEGPESHESRDPFDAWCNATDELACESWLENTDLAVLAMPVSGIGANLRQVLKVTQGFVTDIGSTKSWLSDLVKSHPNRQGYIPGHPMAGHPVGGLKHANAELFQDRAWVICPCDSSPDSQKLLLSMIEACGARAVEMTPQEHDRAVARTSHIPQLIASALTLVADGRSQEAAGPGFLSATRVAGGAEEMWKDIFLTNRKAISDGLNEFTTSLQLIAEELASTDDESAQLKGALALLEAARASKG